MTRYFQIVPKGSEFHADNWTPWVNCKEYEEELLVNMAVNKFMRERGGLVEGERLTLDVYHYDDKAPLHPNGRPMVCNKLTLLIGKESKC